MHLIAEIQSRNKFKMAEVLLGGKKLGELKVTELKSELEKRRLPKKGVKSVLLTRLKNAILREALEQASDFQLVANADVTFDLTIFIFAGRGC